MMKGEMHDGKHVRVHTCCIATTPLRRKYFPILADLRCLINRHARMACLKYAVLLTVCCRFRFKIVFDFKVGTPEVSFSLTNMGGLESLN